MLREMICYFRIIKEWRTVLMAFWNFNASYVAHDYKEQKSYIKGTKLYEPLKCKICGNKSISWRQL